MSEFSFATKKWPQNEQNFHTNCVPFDQGAMLSCGTDRPTDERILIAELLVRLSASGDTLEFVILLFLRFHQILHFFSEKQQKKICIRYTQIILHKSTLTAKPGTISRTPIFPLHSFPVRVS